jgi:hypothetical protein
MNYKIEALYRTARRPTGQNVCSHGKPGLMEVSTVEPIPSRFKIIKIKKLKKKGEISRSIVFPTRQMCEAISSFYSIMYGVLPIEIHTVSTRGL